jgi:Fe-S cluster assembly protein SufD
VLAGKGGHCVLNGLYMPRGRQHMDSHTLIDHATPHCTSEELYKGVLDDEGRGVFSGRIIVRQDAQKTDARQANRNLLLSEKAMIDTKPQLEIYADDVRCTHGATIGRIDETALFYLRSRGIAEADARDILSYAFASDTVQKVGSDAMRDWLDSHIQSLLARGRQKG